MCKERIRRLTYSWLNLSIDDDTSLQGASSEDMAPEAMAYSRLRGEHGFRETMVLGSTDTTEITRPGNRSGLNIRTESIPLLCTRQRLLDISVNPGEDIYIGLIDDSLVSRT